MSHPTPPPLPGPGGEPARPAFERERDAVTALATGSTAITTELARVIVGQRDVIAQEPRSPEAASGAPPCPKEPTS